jgi:3-isopropylmalate/(R)-2-methylmalate dehydratase small subunit
MDKFETVTGVAMPLKRSNVDTDQIIPAVYLKRVTKTGFEDALFAGWRQDPEFVLNQPQYAGAQILVAGFKVVVSARFADIFRGNSGKQGLLAAQVEEADVERIWAIMDAEPGMSATVDLVARTVVVGGESFAFQVDDYTRWRLLEGLDDIGLTLRDEEAITRFEQSRAGWRPKTIPARSL